jgi:regulation of enolase protein 1 (concanavalin A-like superfamily)
MLRLAYFPPELSVLAGVMCASPTGKGFTTRFEKISI